MKTYVITLSKKFPATHKRHGEQPIACANTGRRGYGFEIKKNFYKAAKAKVLANYQPKLFV